MSVFLCWLIGQIWGLIVILQLMQILLQWNQCKIVGEEAQKFWKRGPKYKIFKHIPFSLSLSLSKNLFFLLRIGSSSPLGPPSSAPTSESTTPKLHQNKKGFYTSLKNVKLTTQRMKYFWKSWDLGGKDGIECYIKWRF